MTVRPMNDTTSATMIITSTVGIAIAYFLGRKKSCTGCDVSTNGYDTPGARAHTRAYKHTRRIRTHSAHAHTAVTTGPVSYTHLTLPTIYSV